MVYIPSEGKSMNRKEQQAEIIYKLGLLLAPFEDLAHHPERYASESWIQIAARYSAEEPTFLNQVQAFTHGEPGHVYESVGRNILKLLQALKSDVVNFHNLNNINYTSQRIVNEILRIPCAGEGMILEAYTPFSTYCKIKDICQTTERRLIWVDRYLDSSLFYRYLRGIPDTVIVVLITWPADKWKGKDHKDYQELLSTSRDYAAERGSDFYRLLVHPSIHDRWLCPDDSIYSLGGSIKDAGGRAYFTMTRVESSPQNLQKVEKLLSDATEIYGSTCPKHP